MCVGMVMRPEMSPPFSIGACGRHFVSVQIHACTILDCTITTCMLMVFQVPFQLNTWFNIVFWLYAWLAIYSLQIVWLDRHITTSQVHLARDVINIQAGIHYSCDSAV